MGFHAHLLDFYVVKSISIFQVRELKLMDIKRLASKLIGLKSWSPPLNRNTFHSFFFSSGKTWLNQWVRGGIETVIQSTSIYLGFSSNGWSRVGCICVWSQCSLPTESICVHSETRESSSALHSPSPSTSLSSLSSVNFTASISLEFPPLHTCCMSVQATST